MTLYPIRIINMSDLDPSIPNERALLNSVIEDFTVKLQACVDKIPNEDYLSSFYKDLTNEYQAQRDLNDLNFQRSIDEKYPESICETHECPSLTEEIDSVVISHLEDWDRVQQMVVELQEENTELRRKVLELTVGRDTW